MRESQLNKNPDPTLLVNVPADKHHHHKTRQSTAGKRRQTGKKGGTEQDGAQTLRPNGQKCTGKKGRQVGLEKRTYRIIHIKNTVQFRNCSRKYDDEMGRKRPCVCSVCGKGFTRLHSHAEELAMPMEIDRGYARGKTQTTMSKRHAYPNNEQHSTSAATPQSHNVYKFSNSDVEPLTHLTFILIYLTLNSVL